MRTSDSFFIHQSNEMISKQESNQTKFDTFWSNIEYTSLYAGDGAMTRSFVCSRCGIEHIEVPAPHGILACQYCGNRKRNVDLDSLYDTPEPAIYEHAELDVDLVSDGIITQKEYDEMYKRNRHAYKKFWESKEAMKLGTYDPLPEKVRSGIEWDTNNTTQIALPLTVGNRSLDEAKVDDTTIFTTHIEKLASDLGLTSESESVHYSKKGNVYKVPLGLFEQPTEVKYTTQIKPCEELPQHNTSTSPDLRDNIIKNSFSESNMVNLTAHACGQHGMRLPSDECPACDNFKMMVNVVKRSLRVVKFFSEDYVPDGKYVFQEVQINTWKKLCNKGLFRVTSKAVELQEFDNEKNQWFVDLEFPIDSLPKTMQPTISPQQWGKWTWDLRQRVLENAVNNSEYYLTDKDVEEFVSMLFPAEVPKEFYQEFISEGKSTILMPNPQLVKTQKEIFTEVLAKDWKNLNGIKKYRTYNYESRDTRMKIAGSKKIAYILENGYDQRQPYIWNVLSMESDIPWKDEMIDTKAISERTSRKPIKAKTKKEKVACPQCEKLFVSLKRHRCKVQPTQKPTPTIKLAIVGSSRASPNAVHTIRRCIKQFVEEHPNDIIEVVSGGADGADDIGITVAEELDLQTKVFPPASNDWNGFKARNLQIAEYADEIISCARELEAGRTKCYHCEKAGKDSNHEKTAGCYTGKAHGNYNVVIIP